MNHCSFSHQGWCLIHSKGGKFHGALLCSVGKAELEARLRGDIESLGQEVIGLESRLLEAEAQVKEAKDRAFVAFVSGAKWWEFHSTKGTMWQSDQALVEAEAQKRYPYEHLFEKALESHLCEAEARLKRYHDTLVMLGPAKPWAVPGAEEPVVLPEPVTLDSLLAERERDKARLQNMEAVLRVTGKVLQDTFPESAGVTVALNEALTALDQAKEEA